MPSFSRILNPSSVLRATRGAQQPPRWVRCNSFSPKPPRRARSGWVLGLVSAAVLSGAVVYTYTLPTNTNGDEEPPRTPQVAIVFEDERPKAESKESNRDMVSSQHVQFRKNWENPGVYAWGSNTGKVAAPDSDECVIKTPRRIPYFDGQLLRSVKLDRNFGAAITEHGDLVQWGVGFSEAKPTPTVTLPGQDLVKIALSQDRIVALSSNGSVYSIPVSQADHSSGPKETSKSWIPSLWSSPSSSVSYRTLKPPDLGWGEKVIDISSGLEHCLLLTSSGRVFSAASSSEAFPQKGQLGIPGLTWATRPSGHYDQPHELATLRGFKVEKIAAGDYHSLVLDNAGRLFSFGDNSCGQLGFQGSASVPFVDCPSLVPVNKLYGGTNSLPRVTSIAAGGLNSFFTVDATKTASQDTYTDLSPARDLGKVVADTWACGEGVYGSLGTGKWTHKGSPPARIKALSNLFEFDEKTNKSVPIRVARISVGSTHAAAVLDNVTHCASSKAKSEYDSSWGADVVLWGGNEHFQLGTGKRKNANAPVYIAPLDGVYEKDQDGKEHRFQIAPRSTVRLGEGGNGRKVKGVQQHVECGRYVTAVYSGR